MRIANACVPPRMRELVGRPSSDGFGDARPVASNSNAPTDSRHTFSDGGQSVDRTRHTRLRGNVRSREDSREAYGRARDENRIVDEKRGEIVTEQL